MAVLVTGGARSGKSSFAEQYAMRLGESGVYIATCQPFDEEMKERVKRHQQTRDTAGFSWSTIEEPFEAAGLLNKLAAGYSAASEAAPVVLLDCLTLWLTNWLLRIEHEGLGDSRLVHEMDKLAAAIKAYPSPLVVVTNEVGDGIVPEYALGRIFRDEAGRLNQLAAACCDRVFLVTAGIPVDLKAIAFKWEDL